LERRAEIALSDGVGESRGAIMNSNRLIRRQRQREDFLDRFLDEIDDKTVDEDVRFDLVSKQVRGAAPRGGDNTH
jgi:hypothetical protein